MKELESFWTEHSFFIIKKNCQKNLEQLNDFLEDKTKHYRIEKSSLILSNLQEIKALSESDVVYRSLLNQDDLDDLDYYLQSLEEFKLSLEQNNTIADIGNRVFAYWGVFHECSSSPNNLWFLRPTFFLKEEVFERLIDQNLTFRQIIDDFDTTDYHPVIHLILGPKLLSSSTFKLIDTELCKKIFDTEKSILDVKPANTNNENHWSFLKLLEKGKTEDYELIMVMED